MRGSYFTYMMASRSHTLYVGVTGNLFKRVFQHKWYDCEPADYRRALDRRALDRRALDRMDCYKQPQILHYVQDETALG